MIISNFRWARTSDYDALGTVMFESVHSENSPYSEAQRKAWIAAPRIGTIWNERLASQDIVVAEVECEIVAFMNLAKNEYLDFAYILPAY